MEWFCLKTKDSGIALDMLKLRRGITGHVHDWYSAVTFEILLSEFKIADFVFGGFYGAPTL